MSLTVKWEDISGLERLGNAMAHLDGPAKHLAMQRALNHTGNIARTLVIRTLAKQTGLNYEVIKKAVKTNGASGAFVSNGETVVKAGASLTYTLTTKGGDISLKYFKARETRAGVTAAPFGERKLFEGTFIKGGRFPKRVAIEKLHGHVYERDGRKRKPLTFQNSGVIIPAEMLKGDTRDAFLKVVNQQLPGRVIHEIHRIVPGIFD